MQKYNYDEDRHYTKKKRRFLKVIFFLIICLFLIIGIKKAGFILPIINELTNNDASINEEDNVDKPVENIIIKEQNSKEQNSKIQTDSWNLLLVNKDNPVSQDYKVKTVKYNDGYKTNYIDERIKSPLTDMLNDAKQNGLELCINSGYRSNSEQIKTFNDRIKKHESEGLSQEDALKETLNFVAKPGTSEHETGLAVDIGFLGNSTWEKSYGWIEKNCSKYGFILRYPENKKNITGVEHEPWHFRYVGKEAADEIMESGICLEEYLK